MHLVRPLRSLCLGLLLAGCGAGDTPPIEPPEEVTGSVPDAGGADFTLTRTVRYLTAAGELSRAEALEPPVELLIPNGAGYTRLAVAEDSAGHAVVHGVPAGPVLVRSGTRYVLTSAAAVELGDTRAERPDTLRTSLKTTPATLSITGLQPWNESPTRPSHRGTGAEDQLRVLSPETGAVGILDLQTDPVQGTTQLDGADATFFSIVLPNIPQLSASRDTLQVTQLTLREGRTAEDALMHYTAVRKAAAVPAPDFSGTQPLALSAALQDVAQQPFALNLRGLEFGSLAAEVHPAAGHNNTSFDLYPAAYAEQNGWLGFRSSLLTHLQVNPANVVAAIEYGNPYPAGWGQVGHATAVYTVPVGLPSGGAINVAASISVEDTAARLGSAPVVPRLLPPRSLRVDGGAAAEPRTLASRTPVLTWEAPATGTPTHYEVIVYRLQPEVADYTDAAVLRLPASTHTLQLPEGILEAGQHYVFAVGAHDAPSWAQRPLARPFPTAEAEALTGRLTAP